MKFSFFVQVWMMYFVNLSFISLAPIDSPPLVSFFISRISHIISWELSKGFRPFLDKSVQLHSFEIQPSDTNQSTLYAVVSFTGIRLVFARYLIIFILVTLIPSIMVSL